MRIYMLYRHEDPSGVSGTGNVAEAVEFKNGRVAVSWLIGSVKSVTVYESIEDAIAIHGHDGATQFVKKMSIGYPEDDRELTPG